MALTQDERDVLNGLQSWHDRIEELLALFDGQGEVDGSHRSRAEQLYRALKDDLRKAHEPMDTTAGAARLNAAERACYQPTITEAFVHLTLRRIRGRVRGGSAPCPTLRQTSHT